MSATETKTITVCKLAELPAGEMRLVEADGRRSASSTRRRRAARDRGPLLARRRPARRGRVRPGLLYRGVPAPRLAVRPDDRQAEDPPGLPPGRHLRGPRRGRRSEAGGLNSMTTPPETLQRAVRQAADRGRVGAQGDRLRLQGEVRLLRPRDGLRLQGAQGPHPRGRRVDLRVQGRAAVDARLPPQGLRALRAPPDPAVGRRPRPDRLRRHPLLRPRLGEAASATGTTSPRTSRTPSTGSASPRPSASSSPASAPSTSPRSSTTRSTRSSRPRA